MEVQARGDKGAVFVVAISAQAGHDVEVAHRLPRVFGKGAGGPLRAQAEEGGIVGEIVRRLLRAIHIQAEAGADLMLHAEVGVEEQIGVDVRLAQVVGDGAIGRVLLVKRPGQDEGYAAIGLVVEHVTVLRKHLTAQRTDVDAIQRIAGAGGRGMRRLTVLTRLMDQLHAHLRDVILAVIKPAVEDVELLRERQIEEAVAVGVVRLLVARIVGEEARGEVLREADGGVGVALHAAGVGGEEVERKGRRLHGLLVLHVDLPRDRLVAVAHRRAALRHLDTLHPRRRHIVQPKERGGATEVGHILGQHLHIRAGQA